MLERQREISDDTRMFHLLFVSQFVGKDLGWNPTEETWHHFFPLYDMWFAAMTCGLLFSKSDKRFV